MAEFRFTNEHSPSQTGNVAEVLARPRLWIPTRRDYPDFDRWLLKTEAQIEQGNTRAMLAYIGSRPVGAIIYRRDEAESGTVKIRNISVSPDSQGRYIGSFLLRNTEIEAVRHDFPDCSRVMADTKLANARMIAFLTNQDYRIAEVRDLYGLGSGPDAVLTKRVA